MENAADALKMAAAILIFIIAIGASFSLFGTAKQTADSIITMRDKQAYLEAAEEDVDGILYTSSSLISGSDSEASITTEYVSRITKNGDRVVNISDVVSTIYRYSKEKYGVTIVKENGEVIARFDMTTESQIAGATLEMFNSEYFKIYGNQILDNIKTTYCKNPKFKDGGSILNLYEITNLGNTKFKYGAPWLGSNSEIQERVNKDLNGGIFKKYEGASSISYQGKSLFNELKGKKIIEVTNEIDNSKYLENLLQQYEMPTVEIIYIVY